MHHPTIMIITYHVLLYITLAETRKCSLGPLKGKEMFYLTTHLTHFIYGYMVKDHSDRERERKSVTTTWATPSD